MARGLGVFRFRTLVACAVVALLGALTLALLAAPGAHAQSEPPICQQYPSLPQCDTNGSDNGNDTGGGGDNPGDEQFPADEDRSDDAAGPLGGGPSASSGAAGELPFTGYPLTSALLVFLILLLAGLALRGYLATRGRLGGGAVPRS